MALSFSIFHGLKRVLVALYDRMSVLPVLGSLVHLARNIYRFLRGRPILPGVKILRELTNVSREKSEPFVFSAASEVRINLNSALILQSARVVTEDAINKLGISRNNHSVLNLLLRLEYIMNNKIDWSSIEENDDPEVRFDLACHYLGRRDYEKCAELLESLWDLNGFEATINATPLNQKIFLRSIEFVGRSYEDKGDKRKSLEIYKKLELVTVTSPLVSMRAARLAWSMGDVILAMKFGNWILTSDNNFSHNYSPNPFVQNVVAEECGERQKRIPAEENPRSRDRPGEAFIKPTLPLSNHSAVEMLHRVEHSPENGIYWFSHENRGHRPTDFELLNRNFVEGNYDRCVALIEDIVESELSGNSLNVAHAQRKIFHRSIEQICKHYGEKGDKQKASDLYRALGKIPITSPFASIRAARLAWSMGDAKAATKLGVWMLTSDHNLSHVRTPNPIINKILS